MRQGERPDGKNYFPAFPYTSFTKTVDRDLRDLWAYLRTLAPSPRANQEHQMRFPFGWRFLVTFWKWFFFTPGPFTNLPGLSDIANRGAYLVQALGHCGECHTPRNFLGGPKKDRFLAGGKGPDGKGIPNLTPTRLKKLSDAELKDFLLTGMTADGDVAAEAMSDHGWPLPYVLEGLSHRLRNGKPVVPRLESPRRPTTSAYSTIISITS